MWERYARKDIATQRLLPSGLLALASAGFRMAHLPLFAFAAPWPPRAINPQEPLPAFEEVTPAMARHDLASLDFREVRNSRRGSLCCAMWILGQEQTGSRGADERVTAAWYECPSGIMSRSQRRD